MHEKNSKLYVILQGRIAQCKSPEYILFKYYYIIHNAIQRIKTNVL